MQYLYSKILNQSLAVDEELKNITESKLNKYRLVFDVPSFHPRNNDIRKYSLSVSTLAKNIFNDSQLIFVDEGLSKTFIKTLLPEKNVFFEEARENTFKEWSWLNKYIERNKIRDREKREIIGIGGGLTLNVAMGIYREMELSKHDFLSLFVKFCDKFKIPKTVKEFFAQKKKR